MTPRGEQRRAEIARTALELFADHGYHDTGVADIAARLRMSHGTFYRYFESKRDILEHLVAYGAQRIQSVVAEHGTASSASTLEECREQVGEIAGGLVRLVSEEPRIVRLLLFEATGVDEAMTARVYAWLDELRGATAAYLRHGVAAGYLAPNLDIAETARAVNGIVFAGALQSLREDGSTRPDPSRFLDAALHLIFDGIAAG
jgi:AcrR family transcriptional regulator